MTSAILVAAALLGVALFAGAAPARAESVLCKANTGEERCPVIDTYPAGLTAASTKASFTLGELKFACESSELKTVAAPPGEGFGEETTVFSFSGCGEGCSVSAGNLSYATSLSVTEAGNGTISMASEPLLTITCGAAECTYGSANITSKVLGGEPASILLNASLSKKKGNTALCPATANLEASYSVSSPSPTWVEEPREDRTVMCQVKKEKCPEEDVYPELNVEASVEEFGIEYLQLPGTMECGKSTMSFTVSPLEEGYPRTLSLTKLAFESCFSQFFEACTLKAEGLPYSGSIEAVGEGNGTIRLAPASESSFLLLQCSSGFIKCRAKPVTILKEGFEGGNPANVHVDVYLQRIGTGCKSEAHWTGDYQVTNPAEALFASIVFP